jgi:hypothetical protein
MLLTDHSLLSRAHSNYLAQINIRMGERQEKTSDILGKLTVLGTIVLPMNVVTGIWGMNCTYLRKGRYCSITDSSPRPSPGTRHRQLELVLGYYVLSGFVWPLVLLHCKESVWYCISGVMTAFQTQAALR